MTDKEFFNLIKKTHKVCRQHRILLQEAEVEYERRFGNNPSDVDDDSWIDVMHYGTDMYENIEQVIEEANLHND